MSEAAALRFGIVQGRLTVSPPGELQWFPQAAWREEYSTAQSLGIDYIELIAEVAHNPDNPIWSDSGVEETIDLVHAYGMSVHAVCNDFIVGHSLIDDHEVLPQNIRLIERARILGAEKYVLPLFEASELTPDNQLDYVPVIQTIADEANDVGMITCLETILTGSELITLLDRIDRPHVAAVYDTGNRVAFGHDLAGDIRLLGERIVHVHIKDKNAANENVLLGTGLVNFDTVFQALRDIAYDGPYTFETFRGSDPLRTATYNMQVVNFFHGNAELMTYG